MSNYRKRIILLTNHYSEGPFAIVESELPQGFRLQMLARNDAESLLAAIPEADYLLASGRVKITAEALSHAPKLKMIQRTGVGLDSLDLDTIRARGIPLYVNQGVNARSVAEHTLLLILACLRRLPQIHRNTANGVWKKQAQGVLTSELAGKTVGLIGMGSIGKIVASLLQAFQANVVYSKPRRLPEAEEQALGITYLPLEELAAKADVVSMHCPMTPETANMIDADFLSRMKPGAIFVNTARGGLVDMPALTQALQSGRLSFAGLDVYDQEPVSPDSPIFKLENVILTPHIGGITADSFRRMMHDAMRNIHLFEEGKLEAIESMRYL